MVEERGDFFGDGGEEGEEVVGCEAGVEALAEGAPVLALDMSAEVQVFSKPEER